MKDKHAIKIIRPAPYTYMQGSRDLYTSYDLVARGILKPSVNPDKISSQLLNSGKAARIISSKLPRAKETAKKLNPGFISSVLFNEINYRMNQIVTHRKFIELDLSTATNKARRLFFPKLFDDKLSESHYQVCNRAIHAIELLLEQDASTIVVSHGFFMKFLEIAVLHPKAIYNIDGFTSLYDGSTPSFDFLKGPLLTRLQLKKAIRVHKALEKEKRMYNRAI